MDLPHLGHSSNLGQWDQGGEEQVYSNDAPHPDPLLLFNPFFSFSLAFCCCGEVLDRERILWKDREMFRERSSKRRALGIRERVSTCVKRQVDWMVFGPIWLGPLLKFLSSKYYDIIICFQPVENGGEPEKNEAECESEEPQSFQRQLVATQINGTGKRKFNLKYRKKI